MSYVKKDQGSADTQRARVTITSRDPKAIEETTSTFLSRSRDEKVKVSGPVRLPTRTLKITTRKTPCGNGTNTWDTFELKIYKRTLTIETTTEKLKKIAAFNLDKVSVGIVFLDN
ncbi:small subunit ribosomal protein S20e [Angomonas deanei]|uniref:Ribosomal protein S10p/S20e, putative n=1 Tax=Angomonas deanei TaxID=59799 RepID=S9V5W3_9TRYP|nr:small subunit ribosomal protein S20e [Angomonas deanei]EPY38708.1 small subunit ribosomal protein S20e [Angomonas deanei]CAD2218950.1 Ribosomal protein S10p/S20e, putative [Angomonas deanei]CAD2218952.1 Ribosomal protein S10p/S20e, putative [Angomonas deanei]|eukprot:EPY38447.1 small subunit ribosomal protein S20e [Angomonas deanei]